MISFLLPEVVSTSRLILRRLRYEDAEEIFYTYSSKPEATRFVSWSTHRNVDDTIRFLQYARAAWDKGKDFSYSIRLKENNRLIGSIGIINDLGRIQFGYIISPTQWNQGYATEACQKVLQLLKTQKSVFKISTIVDVENTASIRVLQKCEMIEEATIKEFMKFPNQNFQAKDCMIFRFPLKPPE